MNKRWANLYVDGARLDRIIRILEKKLKKTTDDEKIIKYANSITYITSKKTSKKTEIVDKVLGVQYIIKKGEKRYGKPDSGEKYQV